MPLISKSNCSLHIKQLNDFLKPYHCKINFLKNNPIEGNDHQIRFLFFNLFWGLNQDEIIINSPKLDTITNFILELIPTINYTSLAKIKLNFYIFQIASKHGFFIDPKVDFTIPDSPFISYNEFYEKIDTLNFLEHCPDLETKQTECRYLYFQFCRQNILTLEVCQHFEIKINYTTPPTIHYFITQFQKKFQLSLKEHELKCLKYNLSIFFQEANLFNGPAETFDLEKLVNIFNNTRRNTSYSIEKFLEDICNENREIKTLIQKFPSLSLYCTMLLRVIKAKHQEPLKLLVQSGISTLHRETLISQIKNSTSFPIIVYNFNQLNGGKPDGIISNWLPDRKYKDIPFFSASSFFTDWNKGELSQFLSQLATKKFSI